MLGLRFLVGLSTVSAFAASIGVAGCSSSSSGTSPPNNNPDTGTPMGDEGGATDDASESQDAPTACTPMYGSMSPLTFDAGSMTASWSCFESTCHAQLMACANDCTCNNATLKALICTVGGGGASPCFTPVYSAGPTGMALITCTMTNSQCLNAGSGGDASTDAGSTPDTGTTNVDSGSTDAASGG